MDRIEVYLDGQELALLHRASRETGLSRSELIRRAVKATFGGDGAVSRSEALRSTAGSWHRNRSGAEYVDALRTGDLNQRLARLGVSDV